MDIDKSSLPPSPRPKRTVKRCLTIFCILIACAISLVVIFTLGTAAQTTLQFVKDPHKNLIYNNGTKIKQNDLSLDKLTSQQVIRPLIETNTKFDLLLTIYSRIPNEDVLNEKQKEEYQIESENHKYNKNDKKQDKLKKTYEEIEYTQNELSISAKSGKSPVEVRYLPQEQVIFQDLVLKDLDLTHRDVETTIKFDLPLKRFYDHYLYSIDVRAAIALIPKHPNKLERLEGYTGWKPEEAEYLRRIDLKYIEQSPLNPNIENSTLHWEALETITYAFPLIEFHNHGDPCNSTNSKEEEENFEDDLFAGIRDEEEGSEKDIPFNPFAVKSTIKRGDDVNASLQPHIVSRSHVYIINETRLYDRKAYDNAHKNLRKSACGKGMFGGQVSRFLCQRTFQSNGYWENRFVLKPEEGKKNKELAYAPYIGDLRHAAGPKDIKALPVTRHNCSTDTTEVDPDFLPVNFTLRFSSLTPARVNILDNFVNTHRVTHNATEYEVAALHSDWEQQYGLFGSRTEGTHPIRRLIIQIISGLTAIPILILHLIYWYTRSTTIGINHPSVYFAISSVLLGALTNLSEGLKESESWLDYLTSSLMFLFEISPAILQLRTISPFELIRNKYKFTLKRWRWSHNERNSIRRGTGINRNMWIGVFIFLFTAIYLPNRYSLHFIHPEIVPTSSNYKDILAESNKSYLSYPIIDSISHTLMTFSYLLQISHNQNQQSFAGSYALTQYMILIFRFTELSYFSTWIVGKYDLKLGLTYITLIEILIESVLVYQAYDLKNIDQQKAEEEEEEIKNEK
ncbi:uncharacterized protein L201_003088 [Kwoniella dendrophila CBS 6074]|uniref:FHA domain-containing protein n=1 Tax=Kwoniella dendrophila CBS 6074 TaxID=1295534 RepID=A0AAX4JUK0_9TREE